MEDVSAETLIAAVHMRPAIWDMRQKAYGDRLKRKQAWQEIVHMFVAETATADEKKEMGEQLQRKWKNLRDRYSRDKVMKRSQKSGSGATRKSVYVYSKEMAFLDDIIDMNRTTSSHEPLAESQEEKDTNNTTSSEMVKQTWKKKKIDPVEAKMLSLLEENAKRRDSESKDVGKNDDDLHFLLSLVPFIKNIPENLKLQSRMDIMQTINKYTTSFHPSQPIQQPNLFKHMQTQQHNRHFNQPHPEANQQPMQLYANH